MPAAASSATPMITRRTVPGVLDMRSALVVRDFSLLLLGRLSAKLPKVTAATAKTIACPAALSRFIQGFELPPPLHPITASLAM